MKAHCLWDPTDSPWLELSEIKYACELSTEVAKQEDLGGEISLSYTVRPSRRGGVWRKIIWLNASWMS